MTLSRMRHKARALLKHCLILCKLQLFSKSSPHNHTTTKWEKNEIKPSFNLLIKRRQFDCTPTRWTRVNQAPGGSCETGGVWGLGGLGGDSWVPLNRQPIEFLFTVPRIYMVIVHVRTDTLHLFAEEFFVNARWAAINVCLIGYFTCEDFFIGVWKFYSELESIAAAFWVIWKVVAAKKMFWKMYLIFVSSTRSKIQLEEYRSMSINY